MMDDPFAIAFLLADPALEIKLLISSSRDTIGKAGYLASTLAALGHGYIPVAIGRATKPLVYSSWAQYCNGSATETNCSGGYFVGPLLPWTEQQQPASSPSRPTDFARHMASIVNASERVHILCIGPMTNIAEFAGRYPALVPRVQLTVMAGWLNTGYSGSYAGLAEYNIAADVKSAAQVLALNWAAITVAPLDTAAGIQLTAAHYNLIFSSNVTSARLLVQQYRAWWLPCHRSGYWCSANGRFDTPSNASSILYDLQAAYMLSSNMGLVVEELSLYVNSSGYLKACSAPLGCARMNISTGWRAGGRDLFYERVTAQILSHVATKSSGSQQL